MKNVFISHSSKDKLFVRKLDTALSVNGLSVFLDERSIKVGDSIPSKIYEGISVSDYMVYVISKNSLKSHWVQEELDIAKMRQKAEKGCHILPVLIVDVELPISMMHIKYSNMIGWQENRLFNQGANELFKAMDVKLKQPEKAEVQLFVNGIDYLNDISLRVLLFSGFVDGSIDTDWMASLSGIERGYSLGCAVWSYMEIDRNHPENYLNEFIDYLEENTKSFESEETDNVIRLSKEILSLVEPMGNGPYKSYEHCKIIRDATYRLGSVINNIISQAASAISSGYVSEHV